MIHEFRIKNILSFKEEQTLSFEATSDKSYEDFYCIDKKPNLKLLKLAIIYGPNASGKSNLLDALNTLRQLVLNAEEDKSHGVNFTPFLLDKNSRTQNSEFHLSFFIDSTRYIYILELNEDHIVKEKLDYYPSSQPANLFKRIYDSINQVSLLKPGNHLELSNKDKLKLEANVINNSTLLSTYKRTNVKNKHLDITINWFENTLMSLITPNIDLTIWTSERIDAYKKYKLFVTDILGKADFNISDIEIEEHEQNLDDKLKNIIENNQNLSAERKNRLLKERKLILKNIVFRHNTSEGEFELPFGSQSDGTQRFYGLLGALKALLDNNTVLPIDEIETSLHPELVNYFIKTFLANATDSQLIFTTHNINILMEDFIRRDVVWFCNKKDDGGTDLYSASEFKLHKNISLFNAYNIGKLDAKPDPGDIILYDYHGEEEE